MKYKRRRWQFLTDGCMWRLRYKRKGQIFWRRHRNADHQRVCFYTKQRAIEVAADRERTFRERERAGGWRVADEMTGDELLEREPG